MRAWRSGWPCLLLLAGCIPQAEPPPGYAGTRRRPPPAAESPAPEPAVPADDLPSRSDSAATAEANRAALRDAPPPAPAPRLERPPRSVAPAEAPAPPAARPAWEAKTVAADGETVAEGSITVQRGDTLRSLGERSGVGAEALAAANDRDPGAQVRAGERLRVPGGRYHVVRPSQSGIAIARAYGVPWSAIVDSNKLEEPYLLRVGQRILIPGSTAAPASSAAERAAAFSLNIDDILTGGEPALATNQAPARPIATPTRVLPSSAAVIAPAQLRGGFAPPAEGKLVKRFGRGESGERNDGIEIALPLASPVRAAADGVVAYAGEGIAALGGLVIVRHGDGWTTVYGHASKLLVQRGQSVKRGQTIALSGDSGFADRPELHFEMRKGRTPVDPAGQLPGL